MSDNGYIIRDAKKSDCKEIKRLIQELADFEKMPDGPKINIENIWQNMFCLALEKDGFETDPPWFGCFVAEDVQNTEEGAKLVGYALYFYAYSSWNGRKLYLEDIYVSEKVRGKKIGHQLFKEIAKKALAEGCVFVEFTVLAWNPARSFYESHGSVDMKKTEEWMLYRLKGEDLKKTAEA